MLGVQSFNYENYKKLTLKHAQSYDYYSYIKIYNFLIIIFFSYIWTFWTLISKIPRYL